MRNWPFLKMSAAPTSRTGWVISSFSGCRPYFPCPDGAGKSFVWAEGRTKPWLAWGMMETLGLVSRETLGFFPLPRAFWNWDTWSLQKGQLGSRIMQVATVILQLHWQNSALKLARTWAFFASGAPVKSIMVSAASVTGTGVPMGTGVGGIWAKGLGWVVFIWAE